MRVTLAFPSKKAKVTADGKDLGMFSDSVELDAKSIQLEEYEFQGTKPVAESRGNMQEPARGPISQPERDSGYRDKRFVVTGEKKDDKLAEAEE